MGVGGCIWVLMEALGSRDTGGTKKQPKKKQKWSCLTYFVMHVRAKKPRKLAGMVEVVR